MILTLDGADLVGKTTIAELIQRNYGFTRAPTVISVGKIPNDIRARLLWYENTSAKSMIRTILESDMERRKRLSSRAVIERGRMTVTANCIAKVMLRENIDYDCANSLVNKLIKEVDYSPKEDCVIYLRVLRNDLPKMEQRQIQREERGFNKHEQEYYPLLIDSLEKEAIKTTHLKISPFNSPQYIVNAIGGELKKWNL